MFHKNSWFFILILLLLITACTPAGAEPDAIPEDDSAEEIGAEAISAARQALADFLNVTPDTLEMTKIEEAEWGDSCLGLGGPAESCAAVITPGYVITFTVAGESYIVHTDLAGNQARVESAAAEGPDGDALPPAVDAARAALAQELGVALSAIELRNFEQREWGDSCLGLGGPAESCAAVITPGWQVTLEINDQEYEVHTDFNGEQVRIADESSSEPSSEIPGPDLNGAVIFYERSGGFAGQLLTVRIYPDGTIERAFGEPSPEMPIETMMVEPTTVAALMGELSEADYFSLERSYLPEDSCCDRFFYLVSVQGEAGAQIVEALGATEATPEALWHSIELIEALINQTFSG